VCGNNSDDKKTSPTTHARPRPTHSRRCSWKAREIKHVYRYVYCSSALCRRLCHHHFSVYRRSRSRCRLLKVVYLATSLCACHHACTGVITGSPLLQRSRFPGSPHILSLYIYIFLPKPSACCVHNIIICAAAVRIIITFTTILYVFFLHLFLLFRP